MAPPETVEGSWISDSMPSELAPPMMGGPDVVCSDNDTAQAEFHRFTGVLHDICIGHGTELSAELRAHRRMWVKAEYLSLWAKGNPLPPLVTTSPINTPQAGAGVLPAAETLFGNERVDDDARHGGRLTFGCWLVDGEFWGLEGHYFTLDEASTNFTASSTFSDGIGPDDIILARPFFNVLTNQQDAALVAFPDFDLLGTIVDLDGTVDVRTSSNVQSAGALLRKLLWVDFASNWRVDLLGGYRFFRLDDSVTIDDEFTTMGGLLAPTTFASTDDFQAQNEFHGGEVGVTAQVFEGRWSLELLGKVALGNNNESVRINGFNSISVLGTPVTTPGGLLTQPTNIGEFSRNEFAVLPEGALTLRCDVTCNMRASVGYTVMYLDRVVRSGDQIDVALNPSQIGGTLVGDPRPAFAFRENSFWVQGITAGVEYRW